MGRTPEEQAFYDEGFRDGYARGQLDALYALYGVEDVDEPERGRYVLPFIRYSGDGIILEVPMSQQAPLEQDATQRLQRRLEQNRTRRAEEPGIPGDVDIQEWYRAYLKLDDIRDTSKQVVDDKEKHYRDAVYEIYKSSGYDISDSVHIAWTPQGKELMRYLADDKRHPLNRNSNGDRVEGEEDINSTM